MPIRVGVLIPPADTAVLAHLSGSGERTLFAVALAALAWGYARGVGSLWAQAGTGNGISPRRVVCFGAGLLVLPAALLGPIPAAADRLFSVHMVQHQLLMLGAAPLLVLGRPGLALLWSAPPGWRRNVVRWRRRSGVDLLLSPPVAFGIMLGGLWVWHIPAAYEAATVSPALHGIEHLTMFWGAMLFWASLGAVPHRSGVPVVSVFLAGVATSALATVLLFAPEPLYPLYAAGAEASGVPALVDQRLAALAMWVPSGLVGIGATVVLFVRWLDGVGVDRTAAALRRRTVTATPTAGGEG